MLAGFGGRGVAGSAFVASTRLLSQISEADVGPPARNAAPRIHGLVQVGSGRPEPTWTKNDLPLSKFRVFGTFGIEPLD